MQNIHFRLTYYAQKRFSLLKLPIVGVGSLLILRATSYSVEILSRVTLVE